MICSTTGRTGRNGSIIRLGLSSDRGHSQPIPGEEGSIRERDGAAGAFVDRSLDVRIAVHGGIGRYGSEVGANFEAVRRPGHAQRRADAFFVVDYDLAR